MRRIILQKIYQGSQEAYVGRIDPRLLNEFVIHEEEDDEKYQRAISSSRVAEIARYVKGEEGGPPGILPGSLILGTRYPDKLQVRRASAVIRDETGRQDGAELYYLDLPDTPEEIELFRGTLDIMDGQHRLSAFSPENIQISEDVLYEIAFTLYVCPSLQERRIIFRTTNENQKPVNGNLLMWFREKLGLLRDVEKNFHPIVKMLNEWEDSPLKGRVIMGDEALPKGLKAQQLVKIFDKAKFSELEYGGSPLSTEDLYQVVVTYLRGWETACGVSFASPQKGETATKISAIRYMLFMLPSFWELALQGAEKFNTAFVETTLTHLTRVLQLRSASEIFAPTSVWSYAFRGEGATVKLAEDHARMLRRELQAERLRHFNPLEQ